MNIDKYNQRIEKLPGEIFGIISQMDQIKGRWDGKTRFSARTLGRLQRSALITSAGASTRIEGSKMSDEEVRKFLDGVDIAKMHDRDTEEVRGYAEALTLIQDNYPDIKLTENYLKEIHQTLLKYSSKDERYRGKYKQMPNDVVARDTRGQEVGVVFHTMSPLATPEAMRELFAWLNDTIKNNKAHPLIVTAGFIVEFLRIHPFMDGNGRTSRLMTDLLMLKSGFDYVQYVSMEKIIEDNKKGYYLALRKSQETFDSKNESIEDWVKFFLKICLEQARIADQLITEDNLESELTKIQYEVYKIAVSLGEFAIRNIEARTEIPRPTIRQAVEKLEHMGILIAMGAGRGARYRVVR